MQSRHESMCVLFGRKLKSRESIRVAKGLGRQPKVILTHSWFIDDAIVSSSVCWQRQADTPVQCVAAGAKQGVFTSRQPTPTIAKFSQLTQVQLYRLSAPSWHKNYTLVSGTRSTQRVVDFITYDDVFINPTQARVCLFFHFLSFAVSERASGMCMRIGNRYLAVERFDRHQRIYFGFISGSSGNLSEIKYDKHILRMINCNI